MPIVEEDAVLRALGAFGLWQARGTFLLALVKIPAGWHMLSIIFTAPPPNSVEGSFWCARPGPQWSVSKWLHVSHPRLTSLNGAGKFDACHIYDIKYPESPPANNTSEWLDMMQHPSQLRVCHNFEFQQLYPSMVTQWDMVCNREILANVSQLAYLIGILFGGAANMLLQKILSPRLVFFLGVVIQVTAGTGSAFVPTIELHLLLKLITAFGACCMFSAGFQICFDICGGWQRTLVCVSYEHFWSIGVITLGWISDACGSWINLQVAISVPTVLVLLMAPWIPDSPRWMIQNGRIDQVKTMLRKAAKMNGRKLPPDFYVPSPSISESTSAKDEIKIPYDKIMALLVLWIITVYNYYGALLNMKNIGGPRLPIRTTVAGFAELVGANLGVVLLLRCTASRRFAILSMLLALGGAACISSWLLPENGEGSRSGWPLLGLAMIGRVPIACSMAVLSCGGSTEHLPAPRRPIIMLFLMSAARLCLETAPFMNTFSKYTESIPVSVYGVATILGSVAACYLAIVVASPCKKVQTRSNFIANITAMRPTVWTASQRPQISIDREEKILGLRYNPCFVHDNDVLSY